MSAPFVGRQVELGALTALVRAARSQRVPIAALVVGEPGTGKSRLLSELMTGSAIATSVRMVGFEPMQSVPLAAAGALLRHLATVPGDGAILDRLVFRGQASEDRDPLRIFEAAHRALASHGPALIAIDDIQWVDERSLALIHYILHAAAAARQPTALVAFGRPSPAAAAMRAAIETDVPAERRAIIDLGPLPLDDGLRLAQSIDHELDDADAGDLWRRAGGSPFWIEALARSRASAEPASLTGERLRDLSSDAGALLAVLAIGARPFHDDETAGILGWEAGRTVQASHELIARGLALGIAGATVVAHDLIREAATAAVPEPTKRRLHARLASWIEAAAADDLSMLREALDHHLAAGSPSIAIAMQLVTSPRRRLLGGDDLRLLGSVSDGLDPGDPARLRLDRSLGELAAVLGEQELAQHRWSSVAGLSADPRERQVAELEAARASYRLGRPLDAHLHLGRAREASAPVGVMAVELDALQAEVELWLDHETAVGARTAARALAGARALVTAAGGPDRLPRPGRRAYLAALVVAGDAALQEDRADDVILMSATILEVAEGLDDESHVAARIRAGFALRPLGRIEESVAQYRSAWDIAKQRVLPIQAVEAGHGLARGLRDMGRLIEARDIAIETARLEARIRNAPRRWGSAASIIHTIELSLGDPATAIRALGRDAATEPDPHYRLAIHQVIAGWQARFVGEKVARDVVAALAAARSDSAVARCPRCAAELSIVSAELLARIGQVDEAREALDAWHGQVTRLYLQRELWLQRAMAAIAVADKDDQRAISILERYGTDLARAGLIDELLWARIDLGRTLSRSDHARAVSVLTGAAELAKEVGAVSQARLVARELRRLGVRAWRRRGASTGDGLASLSDREREVADLVAKGASNREIAETLVLSPKTVERHLTNVLAKLGLRNRTEVAALVRSPVVRDSPDE